LLRAEEHRPRNDIEELFLELIMTEALFIAIKKGDRVAVTQMLTADPALVNARNTNGLSAVLTAAYFQQRDIVKYLVKQGADLNLFEACAAGVLERVEEILKEHPEQVNEFAPDGFQPIGLAAFFGHTSVVKFLLVMNADFDTPSRNGLKVTPLNSAAAGGRIEIVRLLLARGADPNMRQADDFVPLHAAAQNGQHEMVELLLKHGADKSLKNKEGKSACDIALESGHQELAEFLK
jgi:ankyrin repeat protein